MNIDKIKSEISDIEKNINFTKEQKIENICKSFSLWCGLIAAQPIPFADFFVLTPIQIYMGKKIADIHGYHIEDAEMSKIFKELTAIIGMGLLSQQLVIGVYKFIPYLGSLTTIPIVYGLTYAMGKVMDYYFSKKVKGEQISSSEIKSIFKIGKDKGTLLGKENEKNIKSEANKKSPILTETNTPQAVSFMDRLCDLMNMPQSQPKEQPKTNKAYLTRASFHQLCQYKSKVIIEKGDLYNIFTKYIIDDYPIYKIFNTSEIKAFIAQLTFLKEGIDEDIVIKIEQYNKVSFREDDYMYIYNRGGTMKYHLYQDCWAMNKQYIDFRVPGEFQHLIEPTNLQNFLSKHNKTIGNYARRLRDYELFTNDKTRNRLEEYENLIKEYSLNDEDRKYQQKAVDRLRNLFIDSGNDLKKIWEIYNKELINQYTGLKKLEKDYFDRESKEEKGNSGMATLFDKEFDYQTMMNDLHKIVQQRMLLCNMDILDSYISKFDYLANKSDFEIEKTIQSWELKDDNDKIFLKHYTIPMLKDFWKAHRTLKKQAISIINEYIQYRYDFKSKEFTESILQEYGLECCTFCKNRNN